MQTEMVRYRQKNHDSFANDLGGLLLFGVADDGEIVGCNYDEVERQVMTFAREGVERPRDYSKKAIRR